MKLNALKLLQILLWLICAYHLMVGLTLNLDIGLKEWIGASLYGAQVDWSQPQFVYILKPLGAFMMALGLMAGMAAHHPLSNKAIIYGFAALFILRGLQRIIFMQEIETAFAIDPVRHFGMMIFMFGLAAALLILLYFAGKEQQTQPQVACV
jgi:hypothetical protein